MCFDLESRAGLRRTAQPCTRTVPFLVVPGRSWNEHDQKSYLERNDPEQGTTRFQKNGNGVVPSRSLVRAQHRNGIFRAKYAEIRKKCKRIDPTKNARISILKLTTKIELAITIQRFRISFCWVRPE